MVRLLPQRYRMTFTELVIVYTSCGAPFAVERLLSDDRPSRASTALAAAVYLGGWPAFLLVRLLRVIKTLFVSKKVSDEPETVNKEISRPQAVQHELVYHLASAIRDRSALQIKELLERYAGLASLLKLSQSTAVIYEPEIARISNHTSPALAAACLNRRNTLIIQKHLTEARSEFFELLFTAVKGSTSEEMVVSSAVDFVELFDPAAIGEMQQFIATGKLVTPTQVKLEGRPQLDETKRLPSYWPA